MDANPIAAGDDALFAALTDFAAQECGTRRCDFFLQGMLNVLRVREDADMLFRVEGALFARFRKEIREALDDQCAATAIPEASADIVKQHYLAD